MKDEHEKIYTAKTFDGKKVKGQLAYQKTFWDYEDLVIIDQRGRIYNIDKDSVEEVTKK